jgi:hypothetical protein
MVKTNSGNDDSRKKRDSRQVVESGPSSYDRDENPKKLRSRETAARDRTPNNNNELLETSRESLCASSTVRNKDDCVKRDGRKTMIRHNEVTSEVASRSMSWDLESASHHVARLGDGCKEQLSDDVWVTFRVGHAGDASTLEKCYSKTLSSTCGERNEDSSSEERAKAVATSEQMEVRLADGLGDEDSPPSIFALIAELSAGNSSAPRDLGAAVLFAGDESSAIIRVEWLYVDKTLSSQVAGILERRLWLRLSALALLMSCDIVAESENQKKKLLSSDDSAH